MSSPSDHSAEVASDYRYALEDLSMNSRAEITNLTVIARENTEHALAISDVLHEHIQSVPPHRKLPALYVLDSIVKNVGTPYTLYFGRKLFRTFMDAYAKVDNATRRKMDEMLKTWKEPVPGSIDTRPVFSPDITRPIETALIKARTAALQAQHESMQSTQQLLNRGRSAGPVPYRETPTPPGGRPGQPGPSGQPPYGQQPPQQPYVGQNGAPYQIPTNNGQQSQYPARSTPQPTPPLGTASAPFQGAPQDVYGGARPVVSVDKLNSDIQELVAASRAEFAQNPHDPNIQTRLGALLDLQALLQSGNVQPDQLELVKNKVAELAVNSRALNVLLPRPASTSYAPLVAPPPASQQSTPVPPAAVAPPPSASAPPKAPVTLDSLFGQGALATLLAGSRGGSKPATPQLATSTPQPVPAGILSPIAALRSPPPQQHAQLPKPAGAPPLPSDPQALLAMLRGSGILGATPVAADPSKPPMQPAAVFPPLSLGHGVPQSLGDGPGEVPLKAASLKQFRPHLLISLLEGLGPPCTQCGRRFKTDEEGRKKKTAHMDWHFKVHQRIADAERRGQHRSWYVDVQDWVNSREAIDTDHVDGQYPADGASTPGSGLVSGASTTATTPGTTGSSYSAASRLPYIPVPDATSGVTNTVCPICQEKFESTWLDAAQDWVWLDAVRVGDRVYHASCHREATRDRGATPSAAGGAGGARATPEPVLGKRKAAAAAGEGVASRPRY